MATTEGGFGNEANWTGSEGVQLEGRSRAGTQGPEERLQYGAISGRSGQKGAASINKVLTWGPENADNRYRRFGKAN